MKGSNNSLGGRHMTCGRWREIKLKILIKLSTVFFYAFADERFSTADLDGKFLEAAVPIVINFSPSLLEAFNFEIS